MKATQNIFAWLCALGLITNAGCMLAGDVNDKDTPDEEAEEAPEETPEDPPAPVAISVSGAVSDYQLLATGLTPDPILAAAELSTDGIDPAVTTATVEGAYTLEAIPVTSRFSVLVDGLAGFYATINPELVVGDTALEEQMLYAVSDLYIAGTFDAELNGTPDAPTAGTGQVFLELNRNNGEPFVDPQITADSIVLVDPAAPEIPIIPDLYFIAADGYADAAVLTPELDPSGKARVALLDVAPGTYDVVVSYLNGQEEPMEQVTSIIVAADTVTLARSGGEGGGGGGDGEPDGIGLPPDGLYGFVEDVYPRLQKTTVDPPGDGCANCHSEGGNAAAAAAVQFNLDAELVYDAIVNGGIPLIDLESPIDSLLITNPTKGLLEAHPTKIWSTVPDDAYYESYLATLTWIEQGAPLTRADNVSDQIVDDDGNGNGN